MSQEITTPGSRLRLLRRKAGITAAELGRRAGDLMTKAKPLSESAVRNHENGANGIPVDVAQAYAAVLRSSAPWILFGDRPGPSGVEWVIELGDYYRGWFDLEENRATQTVVHIPTLLPNTLLIGAKIIGREADGYSAGTMLIFAPALEMGLRAGDIVFMRRRHRNKRQGTLCEIKLLDGKLSVRHLGTDWADAEAIGSFRIGGIGADVEDPIVSGVLVATFKIIEPKAAPLLIGM